MRLDVMAPPQIANRGLAHSRLRGHEPATPMRLTFWLRLQSGVNHSFDPLRAVCRFASAPRRNLPKTAWSLRRETLLPKAHRLTIDFQFGSDRRFRFAASRAEHDQTPQGHLLRRSHGCQPLLDALAIVTREVKRRGGSGHTQLCPDSVSNVHLFVGHYTSTGGCRC